MLSSTRIHNHQILPLSLLLKDRFLDASLIFGALPFLLFGGVLSHCISAW